MRRSTRQLDGVNDDDERRFEGIAGTFGSVFALLVAVFVTWMLSFFISRRLLGANLRKDLHPRVQLLIFVRAGSGTRSGG